MVFSEKNWNNNNELQLSIIIAFYNNLIKLIAY